MNTGGIGATLLLPRGTNRKTDRFPRLSPHTIPSWVVNVLKQLTVACRSSWNRTRKAGTRPLFDVRHSGALGDGRHSHHFSWPSTPDEKSGGVGGPRPDRGRGLGLNRYAGRFLPVIAEPVRELLHLLKDVRTDLVR